MLILLQINTNRQFGRNKQSEFVFLIGLVLYSYKLIVLVIFVLYIIDYF